MEKEPSPISDLLRRTIVESRIPYLKIEQATGIHRASISRFVSETRSLRLDLADKLAAYFGLALKDTKKGK